MMTLLFKAAHSTQAQFICASLLLFFFLASVWATVRRPDHSLSRWGAVAIGAAWTNVTATRTTITVSCTRSG